MVGNLEELIKPYLESEIFLEVLELARQNSEGKIWLMGGFLYKNIAAALYGGETYTNDIDLIVEKRNKVLKQVTNWSIETNSYGAANTRSDIQRFEAVRLTITQQRDNKLTELERATITKEIIDNNAWLAKEQFWAKNSWLNWYYDKQIINIKPIE